MPEGDAVHRAAAALRVLVGQRIVAASPHPRGLATGVAAAIDGRRLEQGVVAGIGNVWAAEALWQARLSPWLPVGDASADELIGLLEWARTAMAASVAGGRTPRAVYRRPGRPCTRCGGQIRSHGLGD